MQEPLTWVWSTRSAGFHAVVGWHDSQLFVVARWLAPLPVEMLPSWQLTQLVVMPACVNVAGRQATVVWQLPQFGSLVAM